jgi:uncharacterized protein (TIGR03382 family)
MEQGDAWTTQYYFGNNGDGSIWYPGKPSLIGGTHDIPVESFRMKMLREGMQDYEYLNLLVKLGDGAFAQMELGKVVTAANSFTSDPGVLEQARLDMAAEIEKDLMMTSDAGAGDGGSTGADGGTSADGGPTTTPAEGGTGSADAGATPSKSGSGCGCSEAPSGSTSAVALAGAGLAVAIARRRRRVVRATDD